MQSIRGTDLGVPESHQSASESREADLRVDALGSELLPEAADERILDELIHHREAVEERTSLADIQVRFQDGPHDYFAVCRSGRVIGLCSRSQIGTLLGSRYGFSLYSSQKVGVTCVPRPLIFPPKTSLGEVLRETSQRTGSDFFQDIILVNEDRTLRGLVPTQALAQLQVQLYGRQLGHIRVQDQELRRQNLDLQEVNQRLRESQGLYQGLFENNAAGVVLLSPSGNILTWNRRIQEELQLHSLPEDESFGLELHLDPRDRNSWRQHLAEIAAQAPDTRPRVIELRFLVLSRPRHFEIHTRWIAETRQICALIFDITEQKKLEERTARQEKQIMLDTLVAGVAHELNNKLTPVLGFADLILQEAPANLQLHATCISDSAREAAGIIKQLLHVARPENPSRVLVDLPQLCRDTLAVMRFSLREANCEVEVTCPRESLVVLGDPAQLKQVFLNLFINALHAMEAAAERRLAIALDHDLETDRIVCRVADNGTGIRSENLGRIFDPFFTTKGPKGTGLGLSISAGIIREHGGEISAESVYGSGATFILSLPVAAPQPIQLFEADNIVTPRWTTPTLRKRALVVDDEELVREFMREALKRYFGCTVDTAADGLEAVAHIEADSYDLILSDVRMPRMDGPGLLAWLQENRPRMSECLVFVTGHPGNGVFAANPKQARRPILAKPFTPAEIRDICGPILTGSIPA